MVVTLPHEIGLRYGNTPQREFKIGVAVPCYKEDVNFLHTCRESIENLDPQPYVTAININWDSNLSEARKRLFEHLFYEEKCDVILQDSVDFYLFPHILRKVKRKRIISFAPLSLKYWELSLTFFRLVFPIGWSGCYNLPREYWEAYKDQFDGYDSSIWRQVGRFNYDFPRGYAYYSLRPYRKESVQELLSHMSLLKKLKWRFTRLGVG